MTCVLLLFALSARAATIAEAVEVAAATPPFHRALWFVVVEDGSGNVVYERNAQSLAIPASVRKLFSAATVAECLGLGTQLRTELWLDGDDLVIRGDGDPSFGSERYEVSPEAAFAPFVDALRRRGIDRVRDIVADVSLFDRVTIPYQWKMGNLTSEYAAPIDALAYRENEINDFAVGSPPIFAAHAFREVLRAAGIAVAGTIRVNIEPRPWAERLAAVESPFVFELLVTMLKPSQNLYAEMLYKRSAAGPEPASYTAAGTLESAFLRTTLGLEEHDFRFVDGSGLAPDDLLTAAAVIRLLRWMDEPQRRGVWWALLAVPGEEGTLRRRLLPLADRLRAKTGSVAGVNTLAGIVRGREGGTRYFAILINHHTAVTGTLPLIDSIVEAIADL